MNWGDGEISCKQGGDFDIGGHRGWRGMKRRRKRDEETGCEKRRARKKDMQRCPIKPALVSLS